MNRKKKIVAIVVFFISYNCFSQSLISPEALSKMMVDYYNFALVGSQTPTSGFKVETNKPSITLKGNILSTNHRRFVINTELEGGLDNGLMQLVSGKEVTTYFKANIGFNFLQPRNIASHYTLTQIEHQITANAFTNNRMLLARQVDTFLIIKTITDDQGFSAYNYQAFRNAVVKEGSLSKYGITNLTRQYFPDINTHYDSLIRRVLISYRTPVDANNDNLLNNFRAALANSNDTTVSFKKILEDYDRIKEGILKDSYTLNDKQYDFEIALTKVNWTWKKIRWWNVSLSASNSNFKLYNPSTIKLTDSSSFLPSITVSYNWLFKGKEAGKFLFIRGGISIQKANSLIDLQKFNYKKETVVSIPPAEELKSTKEGVAYSGELKEKAGYEMFVEAYAIPWKIAFVPGLYLKTSFKSSDAWINKNKVALDLGIIWNVTSSDKDAKNLLSIIPYVAWGNLMKEYKDVNKAEEKKPSDLFSFNVKFGIPINLSK